MISVSKVEYKAFIARYKSEVGEVYAQAQPIADCVNIHDITTNKVIAQIYVPMPVETYYIDQEALR